MKTRYSVQQLSHLSLLLALAIFFSWLESFLPPPPFPIPGFRYGFSQIAILFGLLQFGLPSALMLSFSKSLFILLYRGLLPASLSLSGAVTATLLSFALLSLFKDRISFLLLSIFGALAHNIGQFGLIHLLYHFSWKLFLPFLWFSSFLSGTVNALLLHLTLPQLHRLMNKKKL